MTKYLKRSYFLFFTLASLTAGASSCSSSQEKDVFSKPRSVRTQVLKSIKKSYEKSFAGTVHASQESSLSFKVPGTIDAIYVDLGQSISKGSVLASLESSSYELEVQKAQASLSKSSSQLRNAQNNYERMKKLYEGGNASRSELDSARAQAESAQASLRSNEKLLEIAQLNLSYTKLRADKKYSIASIDAEEGENIAQGQRIFYVTGGDSMEVKLHIPETVISQIKQNMPVRISISALAQKSYMGHVSEIGVTSVQGGSTFPVTVRIEKNIKNLVKAGLSADVFFSFSRQEKQADSSLIVPLFSLSEDERGRFVYILTDIQGERARVQRQDVHIGQIFDQGVEILEGLQAGMYVVTAGVSTLRDGMEVSLEKKAIKK